MKIVEMKPSELKPYARNNRKHPKEQIDKLAKQIAAHGWDVPIVVDKDFVIIKGHCRWKCAKQLKLKTVPVVVRDDLTPEQCNAARLADNKLSELAEVDMEAIQTELDALKEINFDLDLTAFDSWNPFAVAAAESTEGLTDPDDVPELKPEPKSKLGDVWLLGNHRVMCGDSTDAASVAILMNGQKADMVFTDPPYGMFLNTDFDTMFGNDAKHRKTGKRFDAVKGDNEDFEPKLIETIFQNFGYVSDMFLWGADYYSEYLKNKNDGSWIVWDKRVNENMDKVSGNTFELCWSKQKHKRLVARILWSGHHGMQKDDTKKRVHPTQKPSALVEWFFDLWGKEHKTVADLFLGSGSTLIACEKTGRHCYGMELSPQYVDVILKRWQDFTGKKALREDGVEFDSLG
jgi:DNA modification methylase